MNEKLVKVIRVDNINDFEMFIDEVFSKGKFRGLCYVEESVERFAETRRYAHICDEIGDLLALFDDIRRRSYIIFSVSIVELTNSIPQYVV